MTQNDPGKSGNISRLHWPAEANIELADLAETSGSKTKPAASVCPFRAHSHLSSANPEGEELLEMILDFNAHCRENIR